jgi:hypothetical protein
MDGLITIVYRVDQEEDGHVRQDRQSACGVYSVCVYVIARACGDH